MAKSFISSAASAATVDIVASAAAGASLLVAGPVSDIFTSVGKWIITYALKLPMEIMTQSDIVQSSHV